MPPGRHRQSPPLHRLLAPVSVSAAALVCAGGSWLAGEPGLADSQTVVLRGLTAAAAVAAVAGAVLLRKWDKEAGRRVSELGAQHTSAEWRAEERQAELEEELEETREEREKARGRIHDQQAVLARLRNEHATLLRRYAHAEAERARALEGRRRLELESGEPAKALTAGTTDHRQPSGAPTPLTYLQASEALSHLARNHSRQRERWEDQRRQSEEWERERKEEQRLAEERGRQKVRAAAAARQRSSKPASPPGLAPGGFDFFGMSKKRQPGKPQRPDRQGELPQQAEQAEQAPQTEQVQQTEQAGREPQGPFGTAASSDSSGSASRHQPLPDAEPKPSQPEAQTRTQSQPRAQSQPQPQAESHGEAGPGAAELRNAS